MCTKDNHELQVVHLRKRPMQVRVAVSLADACRRLVGRGPVRGGAVVALCLCATIMPSGAQGQVAQWRDVIGGELINALGNAGVIQLSYARVVAFLECAKTFGKSDARVLT